MRIHARFGVIGLNRHPSLASFGPVPDGVATVTMPEIAAIIADECHNFFLAAGATSASSVVGHTVKCVHGSSWIASNESIGCTLSLRLIVVPQGAAFEVHAVDYLTLPYRASAKIIPFLACQYPGVLAGMLQSGGTQEEYADLMRCAVALEDRSPELAEARWPRNYYVILAGQDDVLNIWLDEEIEEGLG